MQEKGERENAEQKHFLNTAAGSTSEQALSF